MKRIKLFELASCEVVMVNVATKQTEDLIKTLAKTHEKNSVQESLTELAEADKIEESEIN